MKVSSHSDTKKMLPWVLPEFLSKEIQALPKATSVQRQKLKRLISLDGYILSLTITKINKDDNQGRPW